MDFIPFPKVPRLSREMIITEKLDGTNASVWIEADAERFVYREHNVTVVSICGGMRYTVSAGSRTRFLSPEGTRFTSDDEGPPKAVKGTDNFGFAAWVRDNAKELVVGLGPGVHYGEWWGKGIQRNYGLDERRFSLFNVGRWVPIADMTDEAGLAGYDPAPSCCHVVPVLHRGPFAEYTCGGMTGWGIYTDGVSIAMQMLQDDGSYAAPGFMEPEGIIIYHEAARQMFKKTFKHDVQGKE